MKNKKGFTLVELLMVVIIVGVLVSIAIPSYVKAVERSKAGRAKANILAIRMAQSYYRAINDSYVTAVGTLTEYGLPAGPIVNDNDWTYLVGTATTDSLLVSATRLSGMNSGDSIVISQEGEVTLTDQTAPW